MPTLRPHNDFVLVERISPPDRSAGGILLTAYEKRPGDMDKGKVLAVGPGRVLKDGALTPMRVKPGDVVLLPQFFTGLDKAVSGGRTAVMQSGQMLLREFEILAVLEEE